MKLLSATALCVLGFVSYANATFKDGCASFSQYRFWIPEHSGPNAAWCMENTELFDGDGNVVSVSGSSYSSSSNYYGDEKLWVPNTPHFCSGIGVTYPQWAKLAFSSGQDVCGYRVQALTTFEPEWVPVSWKFQGSNDGVTWTDVDEQTDISWSQSEWKDFGSISGGGSSVDPPTAQPTPAHPTGTPTSDPTAGDMRYAVDGNDVYRCLFTDDTATSCTVNTNRKTFDLTTAPALTFTSAGSFDATTTDGYQWSDVGTATKATKGSNAWFTWPFECDCAN
jgi:hypothetical protein